MCDVCFGFSMVRGYLGSQVTFSYICGVTIITFTNICLSALTDIAGFRGADILIIIYNDILGSLLVVKF